MFLSKNLSDYIIILHISCRNSLTNRSTKQTFGKRLTCNMLSIGMIIQKNHQCDIPSSSKASALVLASFDHSCIKVDRVGTFSFMHTEVFSSAKKDDVKYCSMFFLYLLKCHEMFVFSVGSKYHFFPIQASSLMTC